MADEGTLATTAEVLLAIGQNASATQILEANTNIWVKWAEGDMSALANNDLVANVGLGQVRDGWVEQPIVTAGDDLARIARFVPEGQSDYRAEDVIRQLLPT